MRLQPKMALWPCTKKTRQTTVTLRCSLKLVKVATFKSRELHGLYESQRFIDIFAVMFAVTWHWMFFRNKKKWLRLVTFCLKTSTKTRPLAASKDINGRSRLIASHRDVSPCQIGLDRRRRQAARAGPVCQWPATANRMLVSSRQTYGRRTRMASELTAGRGSTCRNQGQAEGGGSFLVEAAEAASGIS